MSPRGTSWVARITFLIRKELNIMFKSKGKTKLISNPTFGDLRPRTESIVVCVQSGDRDHTEECNIRMINQNKRTLT